MQHTQLSLKKEPSSINIKTKSNFLSMELSITSEKFKDFARLKNSFTPMR